MKVRANHQRVVKPKRVQPVPKAGVLDGLSPKERSFVVAYLDTNGNATRAAMQSGLGGTYGACCVAGSVMLRKPKVKSAISSVLESSGMGAEEVVARLAEQVRANPADFFDKKWRLNRKAIDARGHLIRKLKPPSRGRPAEIELHDAQAALIKLGMNVGLFSEKIQHVGDTGGPVRHEFTVRVVGPGGPAATVQASSPTGPKAALPAPSAKPVVDVEAVAEGGGA